MYVIILFVAVIMTLHVSRRVGMADDADSKSVVGNHVWVQVPPPAFFKKQYFLLLIFLQSFYTLMHHGISYARSTYQDPFLLIQ